MPGVRGKLPEQDEPGEAHPTAALGAGVPVQVLSRHVLQLTGTYETHQQMPPVGEQAGHPASDAGASSLLKLCLKPVLPSPRTVHI